MLKNVLPLLWATLHEKDSKLEAASIFVLCPMMSCAESDEIVNVTLELFVELPGKHVVDLEILVRATQHASMLITLKHSLAELLPSS